MKNWEPVVLWGLAVLLLVVPPVVRELYPFSLPTMFSSAPRQVAFYIVSDPQGQNIDLERVSLHWPELHDPPVRTLGRHGFGRRDKPTIQVTGQVASVEEVEAAVRAGWAEDPSLPDMLEVRQEVYGKGERGALRMLAAHQWRWSRRETEKGASAAVP